MPEPRVFNYKRVQQKFKVYKTKAGKREAALEKVVSGVLVDLRTFIKDNVLSNREKEGQDEDEESEEETEDTEMIEAAEEEETEDENE